MTHHFIPSSDNVRAAMHGLPRIALTQLSRLCGVSLHTLIKIRDGRIKDPGIDTVGKLWPHLPLLQAVFLVPVAVVESAPAEPPKPRRGRPRSRPVPAPAVPGA